jgi:hypothetical protein
VGTVQCRKYNLNAWRVREEVEVVCEIKSDDICPLFERLRG